MESHHCWWQTRPEGRGRIAAYIPKLGGDPDNPLYFQYASPFGGANAQGPYGMFAVPPDAGVTILVFFAENGDLNEGYWFAVSQEVPSVVSGGAADTAKADGTGQGEGVFKDVKSAKVRPISMRDVVKLILLNKKILIKILILLVKVYTLIA